MNTRSRKLLNALGIKRTFRRAHALVTNYPKNGVNKLHWVKTPFENEYSAQMIDIYKSRSQNLLKELARFKYEKIE